MSNAAVIVALLLAGDPHAGPGAGADLAAFREFASNHCLSCHGPDVQKAGLRLDTLTLTSTDRKAMQQWVKVHDRVANGEMPPKSKPPADETATVVKALAKTLTEMDKNRIRVQGRSAVRRLTRTEYENTIRDLFDLPGLPVKDILPEDGRIDGFDKVAEALDVAPSQLAKYMEAADFVLDSAIARTPTMPEVYQSPRLLQYGGDHKLGEALIPLKNYQVHPDVVAMAEYHKLPQHTERVKILSTCDSLGAISAPVESFEPVFRKFATTQSGFYKLHFSIWGFHWNKTAVTKPTRTLTAGLRANGRLLGYYDAPPLASKEYVITCWLNAGEMISVEAADCYGHYMPPWLYDGPGVAVDGLQVEGPIHAVWPPVSHQRLFGELTMAVLPQNSPIPPPRRAPLYKYKPGNMPLPDKTQPVWTVATVQAAADATRLLADFLPRAFRRPVPTEVVDRYAGIARGRLAAGDCFEEAMRAAYKVALCSPEFLFLNEKPGPLDNWGLISRLSYFLWASPPDETLIELAGNGALRNPGMIRHQVHRMLADPRAERFIADFLDQWLDLRDIDFNSPDARLYPEYSLLMRDSMLDESRAFFRELIAKDLSATNVIHSDFAMLNRRLAEHYGIAGVDGVTIRRVPLKPEHHRGGFLTQASVLKVTANGTTTSPVKRGAWVMDRILGQPPTPPPPDVPAVDPDVRGTTTIRELLAKHRNNASCAACHAKIDAPGFALENYDVIGGWRNKYRSTGETGDTPDAAAFFGAPADRLKNFRYALPVDPSGETADKIAFRNGDELKAILLRRPEVVADNLARRLAVYATGTTIGFADRQNIAIIMTYAKSRNYGVRTLISLLVENSLFLEK